MINSFFSDPISNVRIQDSTGADLVGVAGPYNVGESPTLTCRVIGGNPSPSITWWLNGELLQENHNNNMGDLPSSSSSTSTLSRSR